MSYHVIIRLNVSGRYANYSAIEGRYFLALHWFWNTMGSDKILYHAVFSVLFAQSVLLKYPLTSTELT